MIVIDGSHGEGGGQIVRTTLSLSAITHTPVKIINIRANRPKPGLWPQHLSSCIAASKVCNGVLTGAEIKSLELQFTPGDIQGGEYEFDIGTAGSVTLVAQTIIPILLQANTKSTVRLIGGTHVFKSPGFDYFQQVFIKAIHQLGANVKAKLIRVGYYPKGGGLIELTIEPSQLVGRTHWPKTKEKHAIIRCSRLPLHIADREAHVLKEQGIHDISIYSDPSYSPGNSVTLWQDFCGAYEIGKRGKPAEEVAREAFNEFQQENGDVDKHLADQLLMYVMQAKGESRYKTSNYSEHFKTNLYIIEQFIKRRVQLKDNEVVIG